MRTRTAAHAAERPGVPADDLAVGWHAVPGHRGSVRWWNGAAWAGRDHAIPIVPARGDPRTVVVVPLAVLVVLGGPFAFFVQRPQLLGTMLFWAWVVAANVLVWEVVRGIAAGAVAHRSPPGVGRTGWVVDPAGVHRSRWWDGHRHTEWVADPAPELGGAPVMSTDTHTGPQFLPPAPPWERFGRSAVGCAVLAIAALFTPMTLFVGAAALAVVSVSCVWLCLRNAHRMHTRVPTGAVAAIALLAVLVPLTIGAVAMWNAIGSAQ